MPQVILICDGLHSTCKVGCVGALPHTHVCEKLATPRSPFYELFKVNAPVFLAVSSILIHYKGDVFTSQLLLKNFTQLRVRT